nr:MAG TPA: hypothetical protein [Caudoviricetes sp.]DAI83242.1 MAG TPA: hypothetical protein [Caudoviricetes sp.]DAI92304.1 MAG TPA: hypothetical protein [Bacteriophage sp.]
MLCIFVCRIVLCYPVMYCESNPLKSLRKFQICLTDNRKCLIVSCIFL